MYNNKIFGLEFLQKTLNGVEGTSVLPYRVYRDPSEFKPSHFPGAPRLLLRSNLEGNTDFLSYVRLPRMDSTPRKAKADLEAMVLKWKEYIKETSDYASKGRPAFDNLGSLHFIVHPVRPREEYKVVGSIRSAPDGAHFTLKVIEPEDINWFGIAHRVRTNEEVLAEAGMTTEQAELLLKTLKKATGLIERGAKTFVKEGEVWDASFAVPAGNPHPEFYQFRHSGPF